MVIQCVFENKTDDCYNCVKMNRACGDKLPPPTRRSLLPPQPYKRAEASSLLDQFLSRFPTQDHGQHVRTMIREGKEWLLNAGLRSSPEAPAADIWGPQLPERLFSTYPPHSFQELGIPPSVHAQGARNDSSDNGKQTIGATGVAGVMESQKSRVMESRELQESLESLELPVLWSYLS